MSLKVCHVISSLKMGGAQQLLEKLCSSLENSEFQNLVICLASETELARKLRKHGLRVVCLDMKSIFHGAKGVLELRRVLKFEHPDLVHSWLYHADLVTTIAMFGIKVCPLVWSVHHANEWFKGDKLVTKWIVKLLSLLSYSSPSVVIYCSEYARKIHNRIGYNPKNCIVINNGIDIEKFSPSSLLRMEFRKQQGLDLNTLVVGMIARYSLLKGHSIFLEMARDILKQHRDIRFVMIGTDVVEGNRDLSQIIENFGLRENCQLLGEQSKIELVMNGLDVLVCPSFSESFGLVVAEALACEVPVICSRLEVLQMLVGDEYTIPVGDVPAFAEKVIELIGMSDESRKVIGCKGRERIAQEFDIVSMIERYENVYREICQGSQFNGYNS